MEIKNKLGKELDGFTIYDNYIQKSSINGALIEYIIIGINNHYYVLSYLKWYVISEIEKPERDAKNLSDCECYSRHGIINHLRKLKIMVQ